MNPSKNKAVLDYLQFITFGSAPLFLQEKLTPQGYSLGRVSLSLTLAKIRKQKALEVVQSL